MAVLVLASAIGASVPMLLLPAPAGAIDSPDDLGLTASVAPRTFRQGDGGPFSETDDAYISSGAPDTNFGSSTKLLVDGSGCKTSSSTVCKTLVKFPDFIGSNSGQVPAGSTILSASLELMVTNKGVTQDVYQVTESWSESTATWNRFNPAGMPGAKPREFAVTPTGLGLFSISITTIVQRWVNGEPNHGLLLASTHSDGVDYESSESANQPTLTVQFSAPPPAPPPDRPPKILDLGTLPGGDLSVATDVNDAGQVVGWSTTGSGETHAFLWRDGVMTDLGTLPGDASSTAEGINSAGEVIGTSRPASGSASSAFLWKDGVMTDLGTIGGPSSSGYGINDAGQVTGESLTASGQLHAFLWDKGTMRDLGYPDGCGTTSSGRAINDAGEVAGIFTNCDGKSQGARWANGVWTDLGHPTGLFWYTTGINDLGQITVTGESAGASAAYLWESGTFRNLGYLEQGVANAEANDINDRGQIVGTSETSSGWGHAFLWQSGTMIDLGTLGLGESYANGINDAGDAVGASSVSSDGKYHAVLWATPRLDSGPILDLGTLPGDYHAGGRAINEAGDAVGSSYGSADDYIHGILWREGTIAYLGDLGGGQSYAIAINDAGQVVGSSCIGAAPCNLYDGFVWENGTMSSLPKLYDGGTAGATGINDAGQVVGSATALPSGYGHAVLWEAGRITDLGTLGGYYSGATAINEASQIVGWSEESVDRLRHPFLWEDGMRDLGTLPGDSEAGATAINEVGQVVGWSATLNGDSIRAFLWEGGFMVDLGNFGGHFTYAYGINNAGQVVGQSTDASGHAHAFIWEDGRMTDLGTLGGSYGSAFGINDAGQVVGESTASDESMHAVIWTFSIAVSGTNTLTFQKGDGGAFSETDDAYISSGAPNANFGSGPAFLVDGSGCKTSSNTVCKALIQFPNFIGSNGEQVAPGSVIVSAILQVEITNSGGTQLLYQLTEGWRESGVTWNGFATPGSPTTKGTGISFNAPLGVISVNITAIVQNWVNGEANYGLLIRSTSTDGVDYRSSESVSSPKLIVTVRSP